jgi:hypothetical protein
MKVSNNSMISSQRMAQGPNKIESKHNFRSNASMCAWRAAMSQRDRLFGMYCEAFSGRTDKTLSDNDRELLDKAFPNEAELNVL